MEAKLRLVPRPKPEGLREKQSPHRLFPRFGVEIDGA
jgi:hypothetical protein